MPLENHFTFRPDMSIYPIKRDHEQLNVELLLPKQYEPAVLSPTIFRNMYAMLSFFSVFFLPSRSSF